MAEPHLAQPPPRAGERSALVTGAAGFIGGHLAQRLLLEGYQVRAVDSMTSYYSVEQKREAVEALSSHPRCTVVHQDLRSCALAELFDGVDLVFHQSAQPGVRASWDSFEEYVTQNVLVTERLLAAARRSSVRRFVYASSSSVYGQAVGHPTPEDALPLPTSPYGVTKLAAEHLCGVYAGLGLQTVSLRYFTVYGPRQRPDMALHRLIEAALSGEGFPLYGDGHQERDLTYVDDVVEANLSAGTAAGLPPGTVLNVSGGTVVRLRELIELVEELVGRPVAIDHRRAQPGDVRVTSGDTTAARELLGWHPRVDLADGVARQVAWHRSRRSPDRPRGAERAAVGR